MQEYLSLTAPYLVEEFSDEAQRHIYSVGVKETWGGRGSHLKECSPSTHQKPHFQSPALRTTLERWKQDGSSLSVADAEFKSSLGYMRTVS